MRLYSWSIALLYLMECTLHSQNQCAGTWLTCTSYSVRAGKIATSNFQVHDPHLKASDLVASNLGIGNHLLCIQARTRILGGMRKLFRWRHAYPWTKMSRRGGSIDLVATGEKHRFFPVSPTCSSSTFIFPSFAANTNAKSSRSRSLWASCFILPAMTGPHRKVVFSLLRYAVCTR